MESRVTGQLGKVLRSGIRRLREFAYSTPAPRDEKAPPIWRPRVGVALGGGFARGIAHVGVLKVLIENNIPIDALAGTSAGGLAAAAFASGCSIAELVQSARALRWNKVGRWTFSRLGFACNDRMEWLLRDLLHCHTFEQARIPLAVVAADIKTGEAVTFRSGDLILPVRASCCFPGLFVPVKYKERLLVDGVVVGSVPVAALQEMNVDVIVAVHLKSDGRIPDPTNLFQVVSESFQILQNRNQSHWREQCDVVIEPAVRDIRWDEFERAEEVIAAGEAAAREALPALRLLTQVRPAPALPPARGKRTPNVLLQPSASPTKI